MSARLEFVTVPIKAKVIESGALHDRRLVHIGYGWTGGQDFCIHGVKLRFRCKWCYAHFRSR